VVGTLIGCTDFVDGYLARKHGPTVLGGLLDPIVDKIFVAFCYVPFADIGVVPWWAVALLFLREFVITGLRSAFEQRDLSMKTSYLGKVKTWVQMQGIGMILLFVLLHQHSRIILILLGIGTGLPFVIFISLYLTKKTVWRGAWIMAALTAPLFLLYWPVIDDATALTRITIPWMMYGIVFITWLSGLNYLLVGVPQLRRHGDFNRADAARVLSSIALPLLIFATLHYTGTHAAPLLGIIAIELAVGGLDNLLSHHRQATGAATWSLRTLGSSALLGVALLTRDSDFAQHATLLASIACAITVVGAAWEFWRGSDYYLDARLRRKGITMTRNPVEED
jgi:CDP-diacylglycerol--glycerol-3-phosphate 3-phosphatidyltransferase